MHDIVALAEKLLAEGASVPKVAAAPSDDPDAHEYANLLRKIAHVVRTEGLTVSEIDLDDIVSGTARVKIAADEDAPAGSALYGSPIAAEARALASELRKHAADVRRRRVAEVELELERGVVAAHQKIAEALPAQHTDRRLSPALAAAAGAGTAGAAGLTAEMLAGHSPYTPKFLKLHAIDREFIPPEGWSPPTSTAVPGGGEVQHMPHAIPTLHADTLPTRVDSLREQIESLDPDVPHWLQSAN